MQTHLANVHPPSGSQKGLVSLVDPSAMSGSETDANQHDTAHVMILLCNGQWKGRSKVLGMAGHDRFGWSNVHMGMHASFRGSKSNWSLGRCSHIERLSMTFQSRGRV